MNLLKNIPSKYILLYIVIIGFLLRVNNLMIGFPQLFVSNDEAIYHLSALNMLANKTPLTIGNYGPLGAYIQIPFILLSFLTLKFSGVVNSVKDLEILLVTQEGYLLFIPRIISVLFGTLSILVTYKLAQILFNNKKVALWASFFFAASFNLVHISHQARPWSGAIFFALISVFFAIKSLKDNENKNTLLAFMFAAVAFGLHQIAGIVVALIILVRFFGDSGRVISKINLVGIFSFLILAIVFNFFSLGSKFITVLTDQNHVGLIKIPSNFHSLQGIFNYYISNSSFYKVIHDLILSDGIVFLFSIIYFLSYPKNRLVWAFIIFTTLNLLIISVIFPPFLRYFLISIASMPIFAGRMVVDLFEKGKFKKISAFLFGLTIVMISSFNVVYWNLLILREPTFNQVRKWLDNNIAPQTPIASTQIRNFGYVPTATASEPVRKFKPGYYSRTSKLLDNRYPLNVRNVIYVDQFGDKSKTENLNKALLVYPVAYVVDSYLGSYDRLYTHYYGTKLKLIAHFSPTGDRIYDTKIPELLFDAPYVFPLFVVDRAGPYFDVLKVE